MTQPNDDAIERWNHDAMIARKAAWDSLLHASQWFCRHGCTPYNADAEKARIARQYPLKVVRTGLGDWQRHGEFFEFHIGTGSVAVRLPGTGGRSHPSIFLSVEALRYLLNAVTEPVDLDHEWREE